MILHLCTVQSGIIPNNVQAAVQYNTLYPFCLAYIRFIFYIFLQILGETGTLCTQFRFTARDVNDNP